MNRCFWFRNDLRIVDNTALLKAQEGNTGGLLAVYTLTAKTWLKHGWADCKVDLILRRLTALSQALSALNIPLKIIQVDSFEHVPKAIALFCSTHSVTALYANKQLLLDEMNRDQRVKTRLNKQQIEFCLFDDATILPPCETLKKDGTPFKVFTPFKRNWLCIATPDRYFASAQKLKKQKRLEISVDPIPDGVDGFKRTAHLAQQWPATTSAVDKRLVDFCESQVGDYAEQRDYPAVDGTSKLSAYLASGMLSVRQCATQLCEVSNVHTLNQLAGFKGATCWLNELIWREFYHAIAFLFPHVVKNHPFKSKTNALRWSQSQKNFQSWCAGQTGFPLVDAGMRQLNTTGWMHNRLRMVTAMFLTKTLFINWRWGEDYFMHHLIDGEFAANNGGWQWSASTGTDSVPYFRIFNPTTQSTRFDPEGAYIRHYCPELADCTNKQIHNPPLELRRELGYPAPIVDYRVMRQKVIALYKALG